MHKEKEKMKSKSCKNICTRIRKGISVSFPDPITITGVVQSIDLEKQIFNICLQNGNILECHANNDLSSVKPADNVIVRGWIKALPDNFTNLYLAVDYFNLVSNEKANENRRIYQKNKESIIKKMQHLIEKFSSVRTPDTIQRIGLIVVSESSSNLEDFKKLFQENCHGKLFIYRLLENRNIGTAIEYFKKYHEIDLICLLNNNLNFDSVHELSSITNIKRMVSRKNTPYIVSVQSSNPNLASEPLIDFFSNKRIGGIFVCIKFIQRIQLSFKKRVEDAISSGKEYLESLIKKEENKLFKLRLYAIERGLIQQQQPNSDFDQMNKLKELLIDRLWQEKFNLQISKINLLSKVFHDGQLQKAITTIIESDIAKKIENNLNDNISVS